MCTADPFFDSTEQQDAHEALVLLLEVLHQSTLTSRAQELGLSQIMSQDSSQLTTSAIRNTFQGSFRIVSQCPVCISPRTTSENFQEIDIGLKCDLTKSIVGSLSGTISKYCSQCYCNTDHAVSKSVWQQPKITIIRVNRFRQLTSGRTHKNSEKLILQETFAFQNFKARIIGIVSHIGSSTSSGHYISHVKVIDDWYCCNDSLVTAAEFSDFSDSKECYLLFCLLAT